MKRIYTLDIFKIVLTVLVVFHHFQQVLNVHFDGVNFYGGTIDMYPILELFFLISGFMCGPALAKILDENFGKFFIKKAIRIYPMVIVSILTSSVIMVLYYHTTGAWFFDIAVTFWRVFSSALLLTTGGPFANGLAINPPLWYLCVLIYCYIILYFIVWLSKKLSISPMIGAGFMVVLGACIVSYGWSFPFFTSETGRGYSSFFLGLIVYNMWLKLSHRGLTIYGIIMTAICAFGFVYKFEYIQSNQREVMAYMLWPALMFVGLAAQNLFKLKIWGILSAISFEVYIWHFVGLLFMAFLGVKYGYTYPPTHKTMIIFLLSLWAFSAIMYYLVEKPLTKKLKKRLGI